MILVKWNSKGNFSIACHIEKTKISSVPEKILVLLFRVLLGVATTIQLERALSVSVRTHGSAICLVEAEHVL